MKETEEKTTESVENASVENAENGSESKAEPEKEVSADNKKEKRKRRRKSKETDQVVRIEDLEKMMAENGDDIDPELIVSMYMPRRNARRIGAALLRMDKMRLLLLGLTILVGGLFLLAFMQEKMGNFTINLNRLELYRKGIAISEDGDFTDPTARLTAATVKDATNVTLEDIPEDIEDYQGSHNGHNYMAYTYYVRNAGKEDVGYKASITLDSCAKGAEKAARVVVWKNGKRVVYAAPARDGQPEEGCVNFVSSKVVCSYEEPNFLVGNVDRYTIVVFLEGEDPECTDEIVGGAVAFSMRIDAVDDDNTSLLAKFIQDIKDTLSGDKAISAAGNDAPDYYSSGDVTWATRRNIDNLNESSETEESTSGTGESSDSQGDD